MFERLQKPFLTVETGEAYQPIRLTYELLEEDSLAKALDQLACCQKKSSSQTWDWYWKNECDDLHFESLDSFTRNPQHPVRLGTLSIKNHTLYLNLPSFKRACLALPFFDKIISTDIAQIRHADFINKVFGLDERLPHGFSELLKEEELEKLIEQRVKDYEAAQLRCEQAETAEQALQILSAYTESETKKKLPYAERYAFYQEESTNAEILSLSFYIFLRGRELVAIRRWFGETGYTLHDAIDETVHDVFGNMNIDIIE